MRRVLIPALLLAATSIVMAQEAQLAAKEVVGTASKADQSNERKLGQSQYTDLVISLQAIAAGCEIDNRMGRITAEKTPTDAIFERENVKSQRCVEAGRKGGNESLAAAIAFDPDSRPQFEKLYAAWLKYMRTLAYFFDEDRSNKSAQFDDAIDDYRAYLETNIPMTAKQQL